MAVKQVSQLDPPLSIKMTERFIARRTERPRESWERSTAKIAPWLNWRSVKAAVNNYKRAKAGARQFTPIAPDSRFMFLSQSWTAAQ